MRIAHSVLERYRRDTYLYYKTVTRLVRVESEISQQRILTSRPLTASTIRTLVRCKSLEDRVYDPGTC